MKLKKRTVSRPLIAGKFPGARSFHAPQRERERHEIPAADPKVVAARRAARRLKRGQ